VKILFTGGSSFTGYWFIRELAAAGHSVVAVFRKRLGEYEGVRRQRIELLANSCEMVTECAFGDEKFLELIEREECWDVLCHHAADVTDYKNENFDVVSALANNVRNLSSVMQSLEKRCSRVALTGSVFEQGEGAGNGDMSAFSPYGLSKGLTFDVFRYNAKRFGFHLGKFVIPNPFGPYEEPRFTSYLMRCWYNREVAKVSTPIYVRDNIHVSLLAKAYVRFIEDLPQTPGEISRLNPSFYPESQGAFTLRFATAMRQRLNLECEFELLKQSAFAEPQVRINTDIPDVEALNWDEKLAWDEISEYGRKTFGE
jgi:UDP-glucose 4-epimerase